MEELQSFATVLTIEKSPGDPSDSPFFSLQRWYPRIWDEWARDKDGISPDDFFGDENVIEIHGVDEKDVSFTPLLPSFAEKGVYHGEPRCVNEISFRMYGSSEYLAGVFPKSTGKNFIRAISSLTSFRDYWRVGRNGLLKFVKDQFVESWTIPESQKVVFAWLKDQGWEAELSAPGLLAKQMFRQLDGHAAALMNEKLLALLEHMSGGRVSRDGRPVAENRIMQERDLPIGEIRTRLRDSNGHDICDYLIEKGVFHVGLRLQCPNCGRHSWFQSSRLDDNLICPRCLNPFRAIGNIEKGTWCYKTTGPFSVPNYADGAYATLLALNFFNEHKLMGTRSTPVLNFTAKSGTREPLEADFACFWADRAFDAKSEGLVFGECKTYGQFGKKDFERMRYLAKCFPGAILAFCTLKKQLTGVEARAIGRIARAGRKYWRHDHPINPVLVLTGNELLSFDAPPYCWKDAETQKRFERIHGLLSICNATQQLYLNLPRWEDEWVKRRDPRRGKSQLKSTEPAGKAAEVQT